MNRRLFLRFVPLVAASVYGAATAQQPAEPPAPPLYQVEVLIFAHRDFDGSEERFARQAPKFRDEAPRPAPTFDDSTLQPLGPVAGLDSTPPGQVETDPGAPAADASGFRILQPEELQLTAEARKLERQPTYQLLAHGGWVQQGLPESRARQVDLSLLGVTNPMGSIGMYLSRYLHVKVDVSYLDQLRGAPASAPTPGGLAELDLAPRYDLVSERQTRDGELQYFDHPAFGVLVKVTKVTQVPPAGAPPARGPRPAA